VRLNGLYIVVDLALRDVGSPLLEKYRRPLLLGSLREDVWYLPAIGHTIEHLSFTHFYKPGLPGGIIPFLWPGPRIKANLFYDRALRHWRAGRRAAAFVQLGRVSHLLTDMSCPVHAHRTVHTTDPFEWWVEANKKTLLAMPVPRVNDAARASDLIHGLAVYTQRYRTDATHHAFGAIMKKLGRRKSVGAREAGEQARALIPMAAGYTSALFRLFLKHAAAHA
jgi:hypothetical protein